MVLVFTSDLPGIFIYFNHHYSIFCTVSQTERLTIWQPFPNFIGSSMAKSLCQKFLSYRGILIAWIFSTVFNTTDPQSCTLSEDAGIEP